jgi:antitoxin (DNA-binding transcriptional repressor) of toxin-antitoxin stability system
MISIKMHAAKTQLFHVVAEAEAGEDVIIMCGDVPAVRLVPVSVAKPVRRFGALAGSLTVTQAFFEPLPDGELSVWES